MQLIDSHCHLDFPDFTGEHGALIARAQAAGVGKMVTICTTLEKFAAVHALTAYAPVYMAVGVHPHEAQAHGLRGQGDADTLKALTQQPKVVGVGETGLDFFYERSPRAEQEQSFRLHCQVSRETGLPLIVHTRAAEAQTVQILQDEMGQGAFSGEIHCFTGGDYLRDAALEMGFYISASGITTFKKSADLRATFAHVPLNRVLVETDAPYLAPPPHRGQRNEPAFVAQTAAVMAEVFGLPLADFAEQTTANFHRLFTRVPAISPDAPDAANASAPGGAAP